MRTVKTIIKETKETQEVRSLVEVYEELAAARMQKIREGILASRDFFAGLSGLSADVGADLSLAGLGKSGQVAVFVSAETGLYGDIIDKIFVSFMDFVKKNKVDVVVIGKLGASLIKSLSPSTTFKYFDVSDNETDSTQLAVIMTELINYNKIFIFHGKFKSIVTQETWTTPISGQVLNKMQAQTLPKEKFLYLYEPTEAAVAEVFTKEIATAVFDQTLKESQLAKFASRLMFLDAAIEKINGKIVGYKLEKTKAQKRAMGKKQAVAFSGIISRNI